MKFNEQQLREGLQRRGDCFILPTRFLSESHWENFDAEQPNTSRRWRLAVATTVGVVAVTIVVPAVVASLGEDGTPPSPTHALEQPGHGSGQNAPRINVGNQEEGLTMMQALLVGTLTESNGCLVVHVGDQDVQVLWPRGYSAHSVGAETLLFDADGRAHASVGDQVRLTGGFVRSSDHGWTTDALRCAHQGIKAYFVAGLVQG